LSIRSALLALLAITAPLTAQQTRSPLALTNVTVIDGTGAAARANMTVVITGDRITAVYPTGQRQLPAGVTVRDLRGQFVIPGLIDAHVHLVPAHVTNGVLRRLLRGGVTTVRNMVGSCQALAEMNRQVAAGETEGPDIFYSSVVAGPAGRSDPRAGRGRRAGAPGVGACGHILSDSADPKAIIAASKAATATGMKLYSDMSAEWAKRLTDEAHRKQMKVWAHAALFPARPSDVVRAGVDVLSHAAYLSWETADSLPSYRERVKGAPWLRGRPDDPRVEQVLRAMAERGAILDATLWLFHNQATATIPSPNEDFQVGRDTLAGAAKWAFDVTRRARELGVLVSAGTDGQGALEEGSLPNLHNELDLLVRESGFTPVEAIRSATSIAARTMGLESRIGSVAEGMQADLVVLKSDPTKSIGATRDIAFVVKRGRILEN
jgi:imidazolonepropionase-like amidohydrolase